MNTYCRLFLAFAAALVINSYIMAQPDFSLPLDDVHLNSAFGYRLHPLSGQRVFHQGVDLAARNDPVYAILDGQVIASGRQAQLGEYIKISHSGLISLYGHLAIRLVEKGEEVRTGQLIGISGATGLVSGAHLHFALFFKGRSLDPLRFLYAMVLDSCRLVPPVRGDKQ